MKDLFKSKKVVCIFAHPDDETFIIGGTLSLLSKNTEVQIICVTDGYSPGTSVKNLDKIRRSELEKSCNMLGVKKIHYLNYKDGSLSNSIYHEIATKIEKILSEVRPDTLITFEPRGLTGHLDHIAVTMITTFVFEKSDFVKKLYYACAGVGFKKFFPKYFVYFPPDYKSTEIDVTVDIKDSWNTKMEAMECHQSQLGDIKKYQEVSNALPKEEYFLEYKK